MITVRAADRGNIVEVEMTGIIARQEFDAALERLEGLICERGSVRLLGRIDDLDLPPIPWSRFWDDIRFAVAHLDDITQVAVVADQSWVGTYIKLLDPLLDAEVRWFPLGESGLARQWLADA